LVGHSGDIELNRSKFLTDVTLLVHPQLNLPCKLQPSWQGAKNPGFF